MASIIAELKCDQVLEGHDDKVWGLSWSHDGKLLASCSSDQTIRMWGKKATEDAFECKTVLDGGHSRTIRALTWKPHTAPGQLALASAGFDAQACVW
jgi:cytosolic iron-sulfur protein assembly protein CIAO1